MNKVDYTVGGTGRKRHEPGETEKFKSVAPGNFTKASRNAKPILGNQTRINSDMRDTTLRNV